MNDSDLINLSPHDAQEGAYSLFICALGFERRAIHISGALSKSFRRGVALGFDHNKCLAYDTNRAFFEERNFTVSIDIDNAGFSDSLDSAFNAALAERSSVNDVETLKIAVDISCFDRYRLAEIVNLLSVKGENQRIDVDFWYSVARFGPPRPVSGRNEIAGPVHRRFAGRFADPSKPLALIAGLGYEMGKVVGAAEYLQASRVISFFPESPILEFADEVQKANSSLLDDVRPSDDLHYPVDDPRRTFAILDSVIRGLVADYNVVILPGGPKIFVLTCLIAQRFHRDVSVWRVSSGASVGAKDTLASEFVVGFRWQVGRCHEF